MFYSTNLIVQTHYSHYSCSLQSLQIKIKYCRTDALHFKHNSSQAALKSITAQTLSTKFILVASLDPVFTVMSFCPIDLHIKFHFLFWLIKSSLHIFSLNLNNLVPSEDKTKGQLFADNNILIHVINLIISSALTL